MTKEIHELWSNKNKIETKEILKKCRKGSAEILTAQGSMLMDTRNEDRHVPSATYDSERKKKKKADDLGISIW